MCMELYLPSPMWLHIVHRDIVLYLLTLLVFRAISIPTGYGLGGLGFASPWRYQWGGGARFHTSPDRPRGPLTVGTRSLSRG